jgi:hypothetical protein
MLVGGRHVLAELGADGLTRHVRRRIEVERDLVVVVEDREDADDQARRQIDFGFRS